MQLAVIPGWAWFIISTIISAVVGYGVWWLQSRVTARAADRRLEEQRVAVEEQRQRANAQEKIAEYERGEKERLARAHEALVARVDANEKTLFEFREKIALMDQTVKPLFEAAKVKLIQVLTHPAAEFKVPDELLEKVRDPEARISPEEMARLDALLKERETSTHPEVTAEEKLAAAILPAVIKLAEIEAGIVRPLILQVVSTPVVDKTA